MAQKLGFWTIGRRFAVSCLGCFVLCFAFCFDCFGVFFVFVCFFCCVPSGREAAGQHGSPGADPGAAGARPALGGECVYVVFFDVHLVSFSYFVSVFVSFAVFHVVSSCPPAAPPPDRLGVLFKMSRCFTFRIFKISKM
jgi:hypothetical protein